MGKNKDGRSAPGHFFIVPNEIVAKYGKRIGSSGIAVYCALKMRANKSSTCYASAEQLASETRLSRRAVFYSLTALLAAGLIERRTRGCFRILNGDLFDKVPDDESAPIALKEDAESAHIALEVHTCADEVHTSRGPLIEDEQDLINNTQKQDGSRARLKFPDPPQGSCFERFWQSYPLKQAKLAARMAWDNLCPSATLVDRILVAIAEQKTWRGWRNGFVPCPARWLQERRWEDEKPPDIGHETPEERVSRLRKGLGANGA